MPYVLEGGCVCRQVRYRVHRTMRFEACACHCKDCQTRSGSAFGLQLPVLLANLSVEGEMHHGQHVQPSGATTTIHACAKCLTRLYFQNNQSPLIATLRAGTLDTSTALVPACHFWISSKQPWVVIPEGVPALQTQPADLAEWQRLLRPTQI